MLTALTDAGYVLRHPVDKTFTLGPAVIAVGNAAAVRQYEFVDFARGEMQALADELAVAASPARRSARRSCSSPRRATRSRSACT